MISWFPISLANSGVGRGTSIKFWDLGSEERYLFADRLRPRFNSFPTTGTLYHSTADNLGGMFSGSSTSQLSNGKFDFEKEARWHQDRLSTAGTMELLGVDRRTQLAGDE